MQSISVWSDCPTLMILCLLRGLPSKSEKALTSMLITGQLVCCRASRVPCEKKTCKDIDFVVIRENTEGEFVQVGGFVQLDSPDGYAVDTGVFTNKRIERITHYSFRLIQKRRNKVTDITKSNTLIHSLAYWDSVIGQVRQLYPNVVYEKIYVDNATANFVLRPERFDVILTTNFISDILSDLGGAIASSLGLGPSGNINPEREYPSMFEPIHGSAPVSLARRPGTGTPAADSASYRLITSVQSLLNVFYSLS